MRKRISSEASDFYRTIFPYLTMALAVIITIICLVERFYFIAFFFGFGLVVCFVTSFFYFFRIFDQVLLDYDSKTILAENRNSKRRVEKRFSELRQIETVGFRFIKLVFIDNSTLLFVLPGLGFLYDEKITRNVIRELNEIKGENNNNKKSSTTD